MVQLAIDFGPNKISITRVEANATEVKLTYTIAQPRPLLLERSLDLTSWTTEEEIPAPSAGENQVTTPRQENTPSAYFRLREE